MLENAAPAAWAPSSATASLTSSTVTAPASAVAKDQIAASETSSPPAVSTGVTSSASPKARGAGVFHAATVTQHTGAPPTATVASCANGTFAAIVCANG